MPDDSRIPASRAPWRFLLAAVALLATSAGIALIATGGAQAATMAPVSTPPPVSSSSNGPTLNTSPFPPGPITDLTAVAHTTSITLTWTTPTRGCCPVTGYDLQYQRAFDDVILVASLGNVTTYTISNLRPATEYRISLVAHDDLGHKGQRATISVVTPATDTGPDTVPPSTPNNLILGEVTASSVALSWSAATDNVGVVGYQIYLWDGVFASTLVTTVPGTSAAVPLDSYRNNYYVRAVDAAGNVSIASNTVRVSGVSLPPQSPSVPPSSPAPSISRPTLPSCQVTYQVQSHWAGGFVAGVTITGTSSATISGWTLTFTFGGDQRITNAWNTTVSQTGSSVSLTNVGWNATIQPGHSVSVGFQGTWQTSNGTPTHFALNGISCTG